MDPNKLIEILRATIDPNQREAAEQQLDQVHEFAGLLVKCVLVIVYFKPNEQNITINNKALYVACYIY